MNRLMAEWGGFIQKDEEQVDNMLKGKGEVDKADVLEKMDQFSCEEEMERYIDHKEIMPNLHTEE